MESEWLSGSEMNGMKTGMGCSSSKEKYLVGLYGWRRRCLLFVLSLLLVVVSINLTLSIWMLKVMHFSTKGMGSLKIGDGGVQLSGETMVLDKLVASKVTSRKGYPILIESSKNISLVSRSAEGYVSNRLFLGDERLEVMASSLKIQDSRGRLVLSVEKKEALVGAEMLRVSGDGGVVFHGSVQTPLARPEPGQNLRLESPTRSLNVFALHGVNLESRAGDISANCLTDLKLQSKKGSVRLDAPNIYLPRVPTASVQKASTFPSNGGGSSSYSTDYYPSSGSKSSVYQVCVCGKGRLFLAPPEGPCIADNDVCR